MTGIDLSPPWIEQARQRAAREGLVAQFEVGDAEDLPFPDSSFDLTVSLIGAMFAPRPERVVRELTRVTRPGGRIVMGNWTPESFVGEFFRTVGGYAPAPDMPSPLLWGDEDTVRSRFTGPGVADVALSRHPYEIHYDADPDLVVDFYADHFGPVRLAMAGLADAQRRELHGASSALFRGWNQATDGGTTVQAEILDVVVQRSGGA